MNILDQLIMQMPGLTPHYTKHPIFPDMLTAMIVASLISIGLNIAIAMLRKKTTDFEKMNKVMKETNEWRKQYTAAIKKQDRALIEELKKKQAYVNKMSMEMQQQQMRPMLLYMVPSFMLWIFVFPTISVRQQHFPLFKFLGLCVVAHKCKQIVRLTKVACIRDHVLVPARFSCGAGFLLHRLRLVV
jgi:uncharacterized membrane protein (DUF106 family)